LSGNPLLNLGILDLLFVAFKTYILQTVKYRVSLNPGRQYIDIFSFLKENEIHFTAHRHPAVFTVEESRRLVPKLAAQATKNLFLRDKSGKRYVLMVVANQKQVNLKSFAQSYGFKNLSLASPERLQAHLGVSPGAVSPLCLIQDIQKAVEVYVDEDVWNADALACHPLRNDMTLVITLEDMRRFFKLLEYQIHVFRVEG
jgi:Ala-tRNA(Pro) deacylase